MNIVNIINFVRAVEPREKDNSYLSETLKEELELCNKYNFPSTVLFQYDAFILPEYIEIINEYGKNAEKGLWIEVVEPLCRDAGLHWRGRFPWDWRNDVGFLIGYTNEERIKLIDCAFEKFREVFGEYPASVGSWHIDAFSLNYMKEKYNIAASCNCKEQYGTDNYTIWGGYYGGAYYPSKTNMLCPADKKENQIDLPVFRMLGSDPIHQYDLGLGNLEGGQSVMSLEPVYDNSGCNEDWVKWYFKENFNGKGLAISYAQVGQENSFGWKDISKGLPMQFEIIDKKVKNGDIELLTLGETGKIFSQKYELSPPTSICFDSDCLPTDLKTVWYMSKNYRVNTVYKQGKIKIRDIHIFDCDFKERYLDSPTKNNECFFSNIPFVDGFRFSSKTKTAGIYFMSDDEEINFDGEYISTADENSVSVKIGNVFELIATPGKLVILTDRKDIKLCFRFEKFADTEFNIIDEKTLGIYFFGFTHTVKLTSGKFELNGKEFNIIPEKGKTEFVFSAD